jgi:hypothetical protein
MSLDALEPVIHVIFTIESFPMMAAGDFRNLCLAEFIFLTGVNIGIIEKTGYIEFPVQFFKYIYRAGCAADME